MRSLIDAGTYILSLHHQVSSWYVRKDGFFPINWSSVLYSARKDVSVLISAGMNEEEASNRHCTDFLSILTNDTFTVEFGFFRSSQYPNSTIMSEMSLPSE